jgi:hypothetical protein
MSDMKVLPFGIGEDGLPIKEGFVANDAVSPQESLVSEPVAISHFSQTPITLLAEVADADVFKLHSNPNATKTIFLDFNGHEIANSPWENGGPLKLAPFYSTMNATTRQEIQRIWRRVAEDFAPFNVNVTTEDPGTEALRKFGTGDERWGIRVAFTSNKNLITGKAIKNAGGGGTAYYNSFNWSTDDVALVFNRGEYTGANTASHEIGHALGLTHDGSATGGEYYAGHGTGNTSWCTLMGAPWLGNDELLTKWSKGEYAGSNNSQDDLAVIVGFNGFDYLTDDHGDSFETATVLSGNQFSCTGIIGKNVDKDFFKFEVKTPGVSTFKFENMIKGYVKNGDTYTPKYYQSRSSNLDMEVTLYREDKSVVQVFNPSDKITAEFSLSLPVGTYYLSIDGVGFGNPMVAPASGYTDYGSLGHYMLTGNLQAVANPGTLETIDGNGSVKLVRDSLKKVSVIVDGITRPVNKGGSQITSDQFAGWQILAAEKVGAVGEWVLWKQLSNGYLHTWKVDANWNYVASKAIVSPTSAAGLALQQQFMVDATGKPINYSQAIDPNGSVQLLRDPSSNLVAVKVGESIIPIKYQSKQVKSNQFDDRQILAAETLGGKNQILWRIVSTGEIRTWTLDASWAFVSSDNNIASPTSPEGIAMLGLFQATI